MGVRVCAYGCEGVYVYEGVCMGVRVCMCVRVSRYGCEDLYACEDVCVWV